jgi:DNA-binding LytR/AlgR family response regulator
VPGRRILTYLRLRELEAQLPRPPFVRVRKSLIISLDHLSPVEGHLLYPGNEPITVSEPCREEFFKLIREKG